ncbi:hypothetical protein [Streptomyces sp. NPDC048611]|uniref:hypothetical protein n=1 Tax=unclassified Streptomyces TaxID=2593676 RepID=UPI00342FB935
MSFPPPPNQPNQPPHAAPGGFGPPAGGYGPGGPAQGGYGPGGYGPPPGGNQAPGGYGPPAGGYGPPGPGGPGGPGGWQQPPGPPGGGNGKTIAAIIGGGVIVLAAVITLVVVNTGDDNGNHRAQPSGSSAAASPSESTSPTPYDEPTPTDEPTGAPTDGDFASSLPSPPAGKIPFYLLKVGDCYDRPADNSANNDEASCNGPHDAEVVSLHRLGSGLTTESDIKNKAASLCRKELGRKASQQPAGTAEGTHIEYPNLNGYRLGIKSVSCSLTGNSTGTKKLTKPLS